MFAAEQTSIANDSVKVLSRTKAMFAAYKDGKEVDAVLLHESLLDMTTNERTIECELIVEPRGCLTVKESSMTGIK